MPKWKPIETAIRGRALGRTSAALCGNGNDNEGYRKNQ
jgi:hypothetical protein